MPVNVIGTLKPKNNGKFPVAEAVDIKVTDDLRLDKALENKADLSTVNFALDNKADKTTTTSLQSQINEIITPVTQDAEVENARVGADGTAHSTLKERLDYEMNINAQNSNNILEYIAEIDGKNRLKPSDYEQGGISVEGIEVTNSNYIRSITYVPLNISKVYISSGAIYVKVYKNGAFIGNYNPDGNISTTTHSSWKESINLTALYSIDSDYRIRFVYTSTPTPSETSSSDITNVYSVDESEAEAELIPSDFEQGGINTNGTSVTSYNFIRSKGYISTSYKIIISKSGSIYIKIYKNNEFIGNLEPDGSITRSDTHRPLKIADISAIYGIDADYRIKVVYTTGSITVVNDIINAKGYKTWESNFTGAKISIYGDSISTFTGYVRRESSLLYWK